MQAEVAQLTTASAHADSDSLITWLRAIPGLPQRIFITHGEADAADALRCRIEREWKHPALVPEHGATWTV